MGVRLRQKPKGSSVWYVFINHQGKRKSKKIGKDEKLAREVAEKISAKLILGELKVEKINDACPTFKEYAEMWLSLPHDWRESTRYSYTSNLNNHIYPVLGKYRMDAIKRKDLKLFFDQMLSKGLKRLSLNNIRAPISSILAHAEDSEVIEYNPIHGLKLKHKAKHQVDPLTEKEADLLLGEAKNYLDGFYYPALLCALILILRTVRLRSIGVGAKA
jgi:integrase